MERLIKYTCRAAKPEESELALQTLCAAFHLPLEAARPIYYNDPFFDLSHKRILFAQDGGIASCLTVIPAQIALGGADVPLAWIAGVATPPESQRQGFASQLLAETAPTLFSELGYPVSGLLTRNERLYRRLGWETATRSLRTCLDLRAVQKAQDLSPIRACRPDEISVWGNISKLHLARAQKRAGSLLRDSRRWSQIIFAPNRRFAVYESPDKAILGYAIWEIKDELSVLLELTANQKEVALALINFIARESSVPQLEVIATDCDWLDGSVAAGTLMSQPELMLRIIDFEAALSMIYTTRLAPHCASHSLTLIARDSLCLRNNRPCKITANGIALGAAGDAYWIAADIGIWSALYLGHRSPSEAYALGMADASSDEALRLADRLFPRRNPYISLLDQI